MTLWRKVVRLQVLLELLMIGSWRRQRDFFEVAREKIT